MNMPTRETATILAALRCYQEHLDESEEPMPEKFAEIATDNGAFEALTAEEIDALCEQLTFGDLADEAQEKDHK